MIRNNNNNNNNTKKKERKSTITKNEEKFRKIIEKYYIDKDNIKYIISNNKYGQFCLRSNSNNITNTTIFSNSEYFLYSMLYMSNKNYFIENKKNIAKSFNNEPNVYLNCNLIDFDIQTDDDNNIQEGLCNYYNDFIINLNELNVIIDNNDDDENSNNNHDLSQTDIKTNHYNYRFSEKLDEKSCFGIKNFFKWLSNNILLLLIDQPKKLENKFLIPSYAEIPKKELCNFIINYFTTNEDKEKMDPNDPFFIPPHIVKDIKLLLDEYFNKLLEKNIYNTIAFINYFNNLNYLNYQQVINNNSNNINNNNNPNKLYPKYSFINGELISKKTNVISGYLKENDDEKINNSLYYNLMNKIVYDELYFLSGLKRKNIQRKIFDIRNSKYFNNINNNVLIKYDYLKKLSLKLNNIISFHSYDMFISNLIKNEVNINFKYDINSNLFRVNIIDWINEKFPNLVQNNFTFTNNVSINTIINSFISNKKGIYRSKMNLPLKIKNFYINSKERNHVPLNRSKAKYSFNTIEELKIFYFDLKKKVEEANKKIELLENKQNEKRKIIKVYNSSESSNNNNNDENDNSNNSNSITSESSDDNDIYHSTKKRRITK